MASDFDILVIGGGPAGYAAAIRGAQLGRKVLCVEKDKLGGICLNWGCIPTKALLSNAHLVELVRDHGGTFGFKGQASWDFEQMIKRSREVTVKMNRGIEGLFKKYKVQSKFGTARIAGPKTVEVDGQKITAEAIVIATGTRPRSLPGAEFDGKTIISYKEAMVLPKQPKTMIVIGAGAIGCEFTYFYSAIGTQVTLVEMLPNILPIEDEEVSAALARSFTKRGIKVLTGTKTTKVEKLPKGGVKVEVEGPQGKETLEAEILLVAIGVTGNVEHVFDPKLGIQVEKGHIVADRDKGFVTSVPGIYAIGDVNGPPWLAHVAHHEAIVCIEQICGKGHKKIDYGNVPGCTYTVPGVASVGMTEKAAREQGLQIKVGKFPFLASGRAVAADETEGFVKLIFDAKHGELLGAHMIGAAATEMIAELVMARKLEATEADLIDAMHPHPTFSEAVMEAAGQAYGESVHL
jgi:dihydrolipoamide dehydrogenase